MVLMSHMPLNQPTLTPSLNGGASPATTGMAVYLSASSTFELAEGNQAASSEAVALIYDPSIAAGAIGNVATGGPITLTATQLIALGISAGVMVVDQAYYVSATTPGLWTVTPPTTPGQYITLLGVAISPFVLYVAPQTSIQVGVVTAPPSVTVDVASGKMVPATSLEWDNLLGFVGDNSGGPTSIYQMQDASGGAVDVNGVHNLLEVVAGAGHYSYQNAVPGWTRKAVGTIHASVDIGFVKQAGSLPSDATHSYLQLAYVLIQNDSGVDTGLMSNNDAAFYLGMKTGTHFPATGNSSGEASVGSKALLLGQLMPIWLKVDIGRKTIKVYTPYEIVCQNYSAPSAGPEIDWGVALASGIYASNALYAYGALFIGGAAEKSDATIGAITAAMGWDIAWADKTVTYDGPGAAIACPQGAPQWSALQIAPPVLEWQFNESSHIVFTESVNDCYLVAQAGISAGSTVTSWSRRFLQSTDGTVSSYANSTDSRLPDPTKMSIAMLVYADVVAAAHGTTGTFWSWLFGIQSGYYCTALMDTSGRPGIFTNSAFDVGINDHRGQVRPYLLVYDVTNGRDVLYTNLEKVASTHYHAADVAGGIFLGSPSGAVPSAGFNATKPVVWSGSQAEFSDSQARALLQKLGWTIPW